MSFSIGSGRGTVARSGEMGRAMAQTNKDAIWVLVQFKPNSDAIAVRNLERQRIEVFLPRVEQTKRVGGRFVKSVKPLFPGYLFASVEHGGQAWRVINSTYGVSRIVSTAGKPSRVPDGLVEAIKSRCSDGVVADEPVDFKQGDRVKLASGPFIEWVGEIVEMTADQRAWVLLDLMGRQTRVAIDTRDLLET